MSEKLFYSMGEVAEMFDVNQSLIRHWESQFSVIRPKRNKKGNRLFSPRDVEYLKLIYHLVKERGMTLEGAKKALRQHKTDSGVARDAELMERLQHIRSLLAEVREDLGGDDSGVVATDAGPDGEPDASDAAAKTSRKGGKVVVKIAEESEETDADASSKSARTPRRKKGDGDDKELFAFYEQRLF